MAIGRRHLLFMLPLALVCFTFISATVSFAQLPSNRPISISSPTANSQVGTVPVRLAVRLGSGVRPDQLRARLNGRDVTQFFAGASGRACLFTACDLVADVTPVDGLLRGRNELRVELIAVPPDSPLTFIGVKGLKPGLGHFTMPAGRGTALRTAADVNRFLTTDAAGNYTVIQPDFVPSFCPTLKAGTGLWSVGDTGTRRYHPGPPGAFWL
jgi:hypothetical protein